MEYRIIGKKCLYCQSIFSFNTIIHPVTVEFVNNYPTVCRKSNKDMYVIDNNEIWLETVSRKIM